MKRRRQNRELLGHMTKTQRRTFQSGIIGWESDLLGEFGLKNIIELWRSFLVKARQTFISSLPFSRK
jgi:hypothetical protein